MSMQFKNVAKQAFAVAFAAGLSLNGFALAVGASAKDSAKSSRTSSMLPAVPEPSPDPAKPMGNPIKDNMQMQAGQGKQYGQAGFVGEPINLNVVNADV